MIGVAAVIAVEPRRRHDAAGRSTTSTTTVAGKAALEVTAPFGTTLRRHASPTRSATSPAWPTSRRVIERRAVMFVGDKRIQFIAMGVDPERDRKVHEYTIVAGKPLGEGQGVILDDAFAESAGIKLGDHVDLLTPPRHR